MVLPGMKPVYTSDPNHPGEKRLPGCAWLPNRVHNMFISMLGEFVGTYLFLFFAFAVTQVANTPPGDADSPPNTLVLLYIALAFGFSLAVNVWVFFRISVGLFNPAVSIAMALVGAISWVEAALLIISQILGAISAAGIVSALFPGPLTIRTTLNENTSVVRGLFIEMLLTAGLIFTIFMLAAERYKATFLAPIGIGLALFIAELAGIYFTGGSLNPARSFGPDVILHTFDEYHWIYWVGPLLGAIVAVIFYRLVKVIEYETANPGADHDVRHYREEPDDDVRRSRYRTDGTDESRYLPPMRPKPVLMNHNPRSASNSHYNTNSVGTGSFSLPAQPLPLYDYGSDGHYSRSSLDHPRDRPRAHHHHTSRSHHEDDSSSSYNSGPDAESGSAGYSGTSRSSS
ncbi:aquaporin-like protein [Zopfia rhizophila CBS 207.26]|uniref:Aquaporin-like protein n=1 Tax=Zopfia rhizophila CBS 207.26 TaxID=1314779 RepID=A0A6A6ER06_9PEZI|nr:aquaporin-like protein [Zopfia rhizophila CBS 207.26]